MSYIKHKLSLNGFNNLKLQMILFYGKYSAKHLLCSDDIGVLTVKDHVYMFKDKITKQVFGACS